MHIDFVLMAVVEVSVVMMVFGELRTPESRPLLSCTLTRRLRTALVQHMVCNLLHT